MKQLLFSWPQGKTGAFTTSWDDGTTHDRRLLDICNRHGIKGTWNLNGGKFNMDAHQSGWKDYITSQEVPSLYAGHEIAAHTLTHPFLWRSPDDMVRAEVIADRRVLEQLAGYPVCGMALPYGGPDNLRLAGVLSGCGILYARSVESIERFELPTDFMYWRVTCHQGADVNAHWEKFKKSPNADKLFYLWGHSYEFDSDKSWDRIEKVFADIGEKEDVWYATNMAIYEYVNAWRTLQCSVDMTSIKNVSGTKIWFRVDGEARSIGAGEVAGI